VQGAVVAIGSVTAQLESPVEVTLAPRKPGEEPRPEAPATPSDGSWKRTAGWVSVGVGGALVLTGVYGLVKVQSVQGDAGFDAYRKGFGGGQDVCKEAKAGTVSANAGAASPAEVASDCDSASSALTLQYVGFGLGAVAAAARRAAVAVVPTLALAHGLPHLVHRHAAELQAVTVTGTGTQTGGPGW
jgi:hypothetical protein